MHVQRLNSSRLPQVLAAKLNLKYGSREVSGKSIMGVMMLAVGKGAEIEIFAHGNDENRALDALENMVLDRFGEDE